MASRKPLKESPSPSASTREASSTRYDTQFNPVDTTKNIIKGLGQTLFNAGTGRNGGVVGVGKGVVQSFAGTASRVDDYAVRALNATGIKKATPVALQSAKRNTYGYETADLLNVLAVKVVAGKTAGAIVNTGVPARVVNKVKGQTVGLHGSPTPGLKSIDPRISRSDVGVPTVSFMRTNVPPNMRASNVSVNQQYAGGQGSIYVVKATKATSDLPKFTKAPKLPKVTQSADRVRPVIQFQPTVATKTTTSAKVFAEIPVNKFSTEAQLRAEVARQTRLAGSSMRTQSLGDKIKELKPKKKPTKKFSRLEPDVS